jgi:hypothetical protein
MKSKIASCLLCLGLFIPCPLLAGNTTAESITTAPSSQDRWWEASLNVGFETLHVYRGADSSFGQAIVWESLDVELFDFLHLNLFNGNSFDGEYGELTPTVYVHKDFGFADVAVGMIWYHFPGEDGVDSEEYFLRFNRELGAGFSATAWFSYNARSEGWYHELKLNHSLELSDRLALQTSAALGYSQDYRGDGDDGLDNLTLTVGLPVKLNDSLTLTPSVGYAFALDVLDSEDEGWAALTLSYQF